MFLYYVIIEAVLKPSSAKAGRREVAVALIAESPEQASEIAARPFGIAKDLSVREAEIESIRVIYVEGGEPVHPMPLMSWDPGTRKLLPGVPERSRPTTGA